MRRFLAVTLLVVLCLLSAGVCTGYALERLTILHVNDYHGRIFPFIEKTIDAGKPVGGAAFLAAMIASVRADNPEGTMLLSAGDMFQGTAISNLFYGKPVLEIMNRLGFDAMALGNHEFDWGRQVLAGNASNAVFPFLSANIVNAKGECLPGVKPYIIVHRKGINVAVIGLTTPETAYTTKMEHVKDLRFLDPKEVVPGLIKEVKGQGAQVVLLLTHLGLDDDKKLAAAVPGIDIIVGGHSHTVVPDPVLVGNTRIVQAGYNGLYLGVLTIDVDEKTGRIVDATKANELKLVSAGPEDPFDIGIAQVVDIYNQQIRGKLEQVVGRTTVDLVRHSDGESNIGNVITDAMRESMGTDIAFQNSGGIRTDIPAGKINMEQVYTVLPFDNVIVAMDLTGSDILALLEKSAGLQKGMLQVSGLKVTYNPGRPEGKRVTKVLVGKRPIKKSRTYRVATNDFLSAGGDNFTEFQKGRNIAFGGMLRDVFVEYLQKKSPIAPKAGNRIIIAR